MAAKKRGLGRGLDVLLGATTPANKSQKGLPSPKDAGSSDPSLRELPVEWIQRGKYQPRVHIDQAALQELADSIAAQGLVQPIVVRPVGQDKYELIAGERRWRAAQMAGLHQIPTVIRDIPDEAAIAMALIENIQREDLSPLEEASGLQRLINEFGLTHQQAADAIGRSRTAVTNLLRLLDLSEVAKSYLENKQLEMGHARALLSLEPELQAEAARKVVENGLSVRETEELVKKLKEQPQPIKPREQIDPNIKRLQNDLSERLGAVVQIKHADNGQGKVVIDYNSLDELDGILEHIK